MSTKALSLNDQLIHAFRTGSLPPSEQAERSLDCERQVKEFNLLDVTRFAPTFYLPCDMLQRDLSTLSAAAGANLVGTLKPTLLSLLRPYSILANPALNVTHLTGLTANVSLPIVSSGQASGFSAQLASFTTGNMAFALPCTLSPHLITTQLNVSRPLLFSSGMDLQKGIMEEIYASLSQVLDAAALTSNGTVSATTGIIATAGVNQVTFAAPATFPQLLSMQTPVLKTNPRLNSVGWVASNNTREKLMAKAKSATATAGMCWDADDRIANWPAFPTSNLDATDVIVAGDFSSLVVATFGPDAIAIVVDLVTGAGKNQVKIYASIMADIAVARPAAFTVSTDSAAQ
jgi:HK97 family phage major capsid protein